MRFFGRLLAPQVVLPVALALGFALRLAPCLREPNFVFFGDASYHERLTREVVTRGGLPGVDPMCEAPAGRHTADHLPTGLYTLAASWHRLLAAAGLRDLHWNLALLTALLGGLITLPVWLGARAAGARRGGAAFAALIAVFLPAHLERTHGLFYRYDAAGTLLIATHVALALATLASTTRRRRVALAVSAGLALVAAAWLWRVCLLIVGFELALAALWLVVRGAEGAPRTLWLAVALIGTAGLACIPYLHAHAFVLSPLWLAVLFVGVLFAMPRLGPRSRWPIRLLAVAVAAGLAALLGRHELNGDYAGLATMLAARLGLVHGHDPVAALMMNVVELKGLDVGSLLFAWYENSLLGVWLIASPVLVLWLARTLPADRRPRLTSAPAMLAGVTFTTIVATFLFQRIGVILAPLAAMVLGVLVSWLHAGEQSVPAPSGGTRANNAAIAGPDVPGPSGSRSPAGSRTSGRWGRRIRRTLTAAFAFSTLVTLAAGVTASLTARTFHVRNLAAALRFLRERTPEQAIVACLPDFGYDVQEQAGRATVVDGLLESRENRERIVALDYALMAPDPAALRAFCSRYRATWILVPPAVVLGSAARVTGDPLAEVLARSPSVPAGPLTDHAFVHLVAINVAPPPGFRRAYIAGPFQVYEVIGTRAP